MIERIVFLIFLASITLKIPVTLGIVEADNPFEQGFSLCYLKKLITHSENCIKTVLGKKKNHCCCLFYFV